MSVCEGTDKTGKKTPKLRNAQIFRDISIYFDLRFIPFTSFHIVSIFELFKVKHSSASDAWIRTHGSSESWFVDVSNTCHISSYVIHFPLPRHCHSQIEHGGYKMKSAYQPWHLLVKQTLSVEFLGLVVDTPSILLCLW